MPAGRPIVNHPEDYCHRCLGPNLSWYIDSDVWNDIMRPAGQEEWLWSEIICPACFAELFEAKYGPTSFALSLSEASRGARAFRESTDALPLDPDPWVCFQDHDHKGRRFAERGYCMSPDPRPEYEQDRSKYETSDDAAPRGVQ